MANADLKTFLEDRLRALNPTIDLNPGSPAQVQFVQPILDRLGTDPFETDIEKFLLDSLAQNHPDIVASDPSVVRDTFIKPLILFLEPFKRETQTLKRNQSVIDPTVLSDQDADALVANFFEERQSGGISSGIARALFTNPTNSQAEVTSRFYTSDGRGFFPSAPVSITAEEMIFNRTGSLYYFDIPVQAEMVGTDYNIEPDSLVGVDGLYGAVQVTNLAKFQNGSSRVDTQTLLGQAQQALTERSLVTRRGASARLNSVFRGDVRAVQIIGAKDVEMQRDILVAASPGHAWLQGKVNLYQKVAYVQISVIDSASETDAPVPGDELFVYLDKYSYAATWAALPQANRFLRFKVEEVLAAMNEVSPNQRSYFVRWSGSVPTGITLPNPAVLNGGFSRKGVVRITSLPDIGPVSLQVDNADIHVFGHSDVYVRPVLQNVSKAVLSNLVDERPLWAGTLLSTTAAANTVSDGPTNYQTLGVSPGDILTIDVGNDAGTYVIGKVSGTTLYLTTNLTTTAANLRYRITKKLSFNPFEPKILKVPFGNLAANDLQTQIGSNIFQVLNASSDLLAFGAKVGDTVRLLSGGLLGDFTITAFISGKRFQVDRPATSSNGNVTYQVFTALEKVQLPLVRIKELLLLDSARQSTSITVPYGLPVAVVPTSDFTSAQIRGGSQQKSGYILPALLDSAGGTPYVTGGNVAATSGDRRYSLAFDQALGVYKAMLFADATQAEFDFGSANTSCNVFLATSEVTSNLVNYPPVDPKSGECLTIKNGPNTGSYLIQSVKKFKYNLANGNQCWLYFIQIYGSFPVDVFRQLTSFIDFVDTLHTTGTVPKVTNTVGTIAFPDFFVNTYNSLGTRMATALTASGTVGADATLLQSTIKSLASCQYEWGNPARGVLRTYFVQPTLFEQNTALNPNPTLFEFVTASGGIVGYRADPTRYTKYELVPARTVADADPLTYPRNGVKSGSQVIFGSDTDNVFSVGVRAGDSIGVHEEVFMHGVDKSHQTAVSTAGGSTLVSAPPGSPNIFDPSMTDDLFFIEEGADAGAYRIVSVVDGKNITLDRALTVTTPTILVSGQNAQWGWDGVNTKITLTGAFTLSGLVGKWVTVYGVDGRFQGSYAISANPDTNTIYVVRDNTGLGTWPAYPATTGNALFVVTVAPIAPPTVTINGTQLVGLRPVRIYANIPSEYAITDVTTSPTQSIVTLASGMKDGYKQPYRIFRPDIRRVTPTEMNENQDGALYYFDTEVVSLQPQSTSNILKNSYLTVEESTFSCQGYVHVVDDYTLSYSMKESGVVAVPIKILPLGSSDTPANYISLVGAPIQVSYERADIVQQFQNFLDSPEDRVTAANMLARHFLPSFVSYDAFYVGGSDPKVINQDVIDYIDNLPPETPIDVSVLEKKIDDRNGNPKTPTKVLSVTHDWDRRQWAEFGDDTLGGTIAAVPYNGTPRVAFFVPGPSTAGMTTIPYGERINLTKV